MGMFQQLDESLYMASNDDPILVLFQNFPEVPVEESKLEAPPKAYTAVYEDNESRSRFFWDVDAPTPAHVAVLWRRHMGPLHKDYTIIQIVKNEITKQKSD